MSKSYRFPVFLVLLAVAAVSLVGCLKPGGNDSSSAPPSILAPDTTNTGLSSMGPTVLFKRVNVTFSHDKHVTTFKRNCVDCHKAGGVASTPWDMKYQEGAYKMADMWAGKGCGICHKSGGAAFDCNIQVNAAGKWDASNCERCHGDVHVLVNAGEVGTATCGICHEGHVKEFDESIHGHGEDGKVGQTHWFQTHMTAQNGARCVECHNNEGMAIRAESSPTTFEANLMATSMAGNHAMACQTCHYPNLQVAGSKDHERRLRESGDMLCGSCHHFRFGYSKFPVTEAVFPTTLTSGILNLSSSSTLLTTTAAAFPIVWAQAYNMNVGSLTTVTSAATLATYTTNLTNMVWNTWFSPHDGSGQYEVVHGNDYNGSSGGVSGLFIRFSRDRNGTLLTYGDSGNGKDPSSCIKCHMVGDKKTTFGHTFKASAELQASFKTKQTEIDDLLESLRKKLKAAGGTGSPLYFATASGLGTDYAKLVTNGVPVTTRIVFLAAYWNWAFLNNSNVPEVADEHNPPTHILAVHNYEFARDLLTNTNTILTQLRDAGITGLSWY